MRTERDNPCFLYSQPEGMITMLHQNQDQDQCPSDQYQLDHTDQDQNQEDQEVFSAESYPVLAAVAVIDLVELVVVSSVD